MLAILADDLTGALDTAAPFAARGMHAQIALNTGAISAALREAPDVLSINLASREISEEAARREVEAALAALPAGIRLFKKVDSRLKGHIAAELDVMNFRTALVAPAIPEFGRVVKGGHVQGFGVEAPISIDGTLGRHSARVLVPDTMTQDDMRAVLKEALAAADLDLLIGARGLAEALAEDMSNGAEAQTAEIPGGPVLFVIGSRDPITLAQIDVLRAAFSPHYLPAANGRLVGVRGIGDSLLTLVQAVPGETTVSSKEVSQALAESVFPALTQRASTLLLSGGATAEAVLMAMGIERFRLLGECLPGLGLAYAQGHCIIAKSGGFGDPDTLRHIADMVVRKVG